MEYSPDIGPNEHAENGGFTYRSRVEADRELIIRRNGVTALTEVDEQRWRIPSTRPRKEDMAEEAARGIHGVEDVLVLLDRLAEQSVGEDDVQDFEISRAIVAGLRDEVRVLRAAVGELARVVVRDATGSAGVAAGGPARLVMALPELGVESPAPEGEVEFVAGRHPVLGQALRELRGG